MKYAILAFALLSASLQLKGQQLPAMGYCYYTAGATWIPVISSGTGSGFTPGTSTLLYGMNGAVPAALTCDSSGHLTPGGTAGGDLSGTYPNPSVVGLKTVPFCTGFTPTNGQFVQYTTGGTPNPCYSAAAGGSGSFSQLSGDATSTATGGATTVTGLNGTSLAGLASGFAFITTTTGVPSTVAKFGAGAGVTTSADPGTTVNVPIVSDGAHGDKPWPTGALGTVATHATGDFTLSTVVPNTVPTAAQLLIGNAGGTAYAAVSMSGDCTVTSAGAITCTKTNGSAFAASATTDTTNGTNISSGTVAAARLPAALANSTSINGTSVPSAVTLSQTIGSGTAAMPTGAISSATCSSAVTVVASGVLTTDSIEFTFNADPTATTGYAASASGSLYIYSYPTSGNVNFKVCNNTSGSVTPSAATVNWRVAR